MNWQVSLRDAILFFANAGFRSAAVTEPMMYVNRFLHAAARQLVPELGRHDLVPSDKVGVRAQLVHWASKSLVMDFLAVEERRALHVLNAISPGFTSSMAFASHLAERNSFPIRRAPCRFTPHGSTSPRWL